MRQTAPLYGKISHLFQKSSKFSKTALEACVAYIFASWKTSAMDGKVLVRKEGRLDFANDVDLEIKSSYCGVSSVGEVWRLWYQ